MARTDRRPRRRLDADTRRDAILAAAAQAFADAPYPQVSVAAIAAGEDASEALVYRYFGSKAELYAQVVRLAIDHLAQEQRAADAALPPYTSARDRVRVSLEVYLDHIAASAPGWAAPFRYAGNDPEPSLRVRRAARAAYVEALRELLQPTGGLRQDYALWGYFGFLDGACLAWVERGCPDTERPALIESALGALEGALGDWGR